MSETAPTFERLIEEAWSQPIVGWDFSYLVGRWREPDLPWDYIGRVREALRQATALLDMGTGGGELLASLQPLPPVVYATEGYPPNVPVATARLAPLGVHVRAIEDDAHLPLPDSFFDLVINRQEKFIAEEVARILKPGGRFITQQVGERNLAEINDWLGAPLTLRPSSYERAQRFLATSGLEIVDRDEAFPERAFYDVGALVYFLKAVAWQVPGFTPQRFEPQLRAIRAHIQSAEALVGRDHRYFIEAYKPDR